MYDAETNEVTDRNPDFQCKEGTDCMEVEWSEPNWSNGRVPGMNVLNPSLRDTVRDHNSMLALHLLTFRR